MNTAIPALRHALSKTQEPRLRQQIADTIERLQKRESHDRGRVARHGGCESRPLPSAPSRKDKAASKIKARGSTVPQTERTNGKGS